MTNPTVHKPLLLHLELVELLSEQLQKTLSLCLLTSKLQVIDVSGADENQDPMVAAQEVLDVQERVGLRRSQSSRNQRSL